MASEADAEKNMVQAAAPESKVRMASSAEKRRASEESALPTGCLSYEPEQVTVQGVLRAQGTDWILTPDNPVCVSGKSATETNVQEIQLILDPAGSAKVGTLAAKSVAVRGTLVHASASSHRTRVLMNVLDIAERSVERTP